MKIRLKMSIIILLFLIINFPLTNGSNDLVFPEFHHSIRICAVPINIIFLNETNSDIGNETPEIMEYNLSFKVNENGNIRVTIDAVMKFQKVLKEKIEEGTISLEIETIKNGSYKIKNGTIVFYNILDNDCKITTVNYLNLSEKGGENIEATYEIDYEKNIIIAYIEPRENHYSINSDEIYIEIEYDLKNCINKFIPVGENYWFHQLSMDFYPNFYVWKLNIKIELPENYDINLQNPIGIEEIDNNTIINKLQYLTPDNHIEYKLEYNTHLSLFDKISINWDIQLFWIIISAIVGFVVGYFFNNLLKNKKSNIIQSDENVFKSYTNRDWLSSELRNRKTPKTIAKKCNVHVSTIYRYMRKFRLK